MNYAYLQLPAPPPPTQKPPDNYPDYENSWVIEDPPDPNGAEEKENQRVIVIQL